MANMGDWPSTHTLFSSGDSTVPLEPDAKLIVSTPESDPYMSSSSKDFVSEEGLSNGSGNMA
jgi:hypothetical protein